MKLDEVIKKLEHLCEIEGSIRKWAIANGLDFSHVAKVISRKVPPSKKLLDKLGLERHSVFKKKNIKFEDV